MRLTTGQRPDKAGVMTEGSDIQPLFFEGARAIVGAIGDPAVKAAWDRPSVLEEQLVSSVAGHLARSGIWVVAEYLEGTPTGRPDFESAGAYFAAVAVGASPEMKRSVRDRGAAVASLGREEILRRSRDTLSLLETNLAELGPGHLMAVMAGKVMTLSDYLVTRVVEQAVHLDDLARSVEREPWPLSAEHHALAISVATDIACRAHGSDATLRAVYRRGFAEAVFPVF
jgi:Mycothiol maleylpyruvate isomerase N-terminal domain